MTIIAIARAKTFLTLGISAVCLSCFLPRAHAQEDQSLQITGNCTPRTAEQGPWDCKVTKLVRDGCTTKKSKGYDEVWKLVRNEEEASLLLKSMYKNLGGPQRFYQWLACQGFDHVQIFSPEIEFPGMREDEVSVRIGLGFDPNRSPFPIPFLARYASYAADIEIEINPFGQISSIKPSYTFE